VATRGGGWRGAAGRAPPASSVRRARRVASVRQPPILEAGATGGRCQFSPCTTPRPRIPAPGPCAPASAPAPAPAPAPVPAETRPTSDQQPLNYTNPTSSLRHCQASVSITAPVTAQTLPSNAPEVYYDTACQLVTEPSRPIRRPDKTLRLETGGGSDFAVIWP